jgi:hypothetical protein
MRTIGIVVLLVTGLVLGYMATYLLLQDSNNEPSSGVAFAPINFDLAFSAGIARPGSLGNGWEKKARRGAYGRRMLGRRCSSHFLAEQEVTPFCF